MLGFYVFPSMMMWSLPFFFPPRCILSIFFLYAPFPSVSVYSADSPPVSESPHHPSPIVRPSENPTSYSDELINLRWYYWGGSLNLYRPLRVSSLSEILTTGVQPGAILFFRTWSNLLLHKYLIASKTNQFSLQYLQQLKRNLFRYFLLSTDSWCMSE